MSSSWEHYTLWCLGAARSHFHFCLSWASLVNKPQEHCTAFILLSTVLLRVGPPPPFDRPKNLTSLKRPSLTPGPVISMAVETVPWVTSRLPSIACLRFFSVWRCHWNGKDCSIVVELSLWLLDCIALSINPLFASHQKRIGNLQNFLSYLSRKI